MNEITLSEFVIDLPDGPGNGLLREAADIDFDFHREAQRHAEVMAALHLKQMRFMDCIRAHWTEEEIELAMRRDKTLA